MAPAAASAEHLAAMRAALAHRGGDGEATHLDPEKGIAIGHLYRANFRRPGEAVLPALATTSNKMLTNKMATRAWMMELRKAMKMPRFNSFSVASSQAEMTVLSVCGAGYNHGSSPSHLLLKWKTYLGVSWASLLQRALRPPIGIPILSWITLMPCWKRAWRAKCPFTSIT